MIGQLATAGVVDPKVVETVQREGTRHHARLATARALVFHLLAAPPLATLPSDQRGSEIAKREGRLDAARTLAADGLRAQPNSWQATMLLGATTYLQWSIDRDPRLFTESATWQEPMLAALREAPGQPEPRRLLATAYLELWPALSADRKAFARDLLRETFVQDPDSFARLSPTWMALADSTEEAFSVVPQTPEAWGLLAKEFARNHQWQLFREAHLHALDAREAVLEARLADGMKRLSLGDDFHSRTRFARVVAEAPRTLRFASLVNRALAHYPPGLQTAGTGTALRDWLAWSLQMETVWVAPLTPPNVARLATIAERLPPPEAALAALIGGDLALADRLERLELTITVPSWAPYLLAKTRYFLDRDLLVDARATLERLGIGSRRGIAYHLLRQKLARAEGQEDVAKEAANDLRQHRTSTWPATVWQRERDHYRLPLLPASPATHLAIEVAQAPAVGAVVEVIWDGAVVRTIPVYAGGIVTVPVTARTDKPSWLEWRTLAGEAARPGDVRLR